MRRMRQEERTESSDAFLDRLRRMCWLSIQIFCCLFALVRINGRQEGGQRGWLEGWEGGVKRGSRRGTSVLLQM